MKTRKIIALVLSLIMVLSLCGSAFAADGEIILPAAEAVVNGATYNQRNDQISNIRVNGTITYTVPEGVSGNYDIYLEVGTVRMAWGCTPFYVTVNGDTKTVPIIHAASSGSNYGIFKLRTNTPLKAGDEITLSGQPGYMAAMMMPSIRNVKLYPAGTEVGLGYNNEIPVEEEVDVNDPLSGLDIIWLGSSVTIGMQSGGYSMADAIADNHAATNSYKYAISGTTLVQEPGVAPENDSSYVYRMTTIDKDIDADYFIVQLSTNDATNNKPLGELAEGFDRDTFDTTTIYGAMEYIISYAQETWDCPVMFYSGSYYESEAYGNMVKAMLNIQDKWGIDVIDMYNNEEMTAIYGTKLYYTYVASDGIHPYRAGYVDWWTPYFEEVLTDVVPHMVIEDAIADADSNEAEVAVYYKGESDVQGITMEINAELPIKAIKADGFSYVNGNKVVVASGSAMDKSEPLFTVIFDTTDVHGEYAVSGTVIEFVDGNDKLAAIPAVLSGTVIAAQMGDVDVDGQITTVDLIKIARYIIDAEELTPVQIKLADIDGDGVITTADLVKLARMIVAE